MYPDTRELPRPNSQGLVLAQSWPGAAHLDVLLLNTGKAICDHNGTETKIRHSVIMSEHRENRVLSKPQT